LLFPIWEECKYKSLSEKRSKKCCIELHIDDTELHIDDTELHIDDTEVHREGTEVHRDDTEVHRDDTEVHRDVKRDLEIDKTNYKLCGSLS
jgi:hypothetical protein